MKHLFNKHATGGLFEQNFRFFVVSKKIDASVQATIDKRPDDFWFLNNGIIIGCKEFRPDGDTVKLYDFSIINGCQTTSLIGKYGGKNEGVDFAIPCKIVSLAGNRGPEFLAEVAESSNSQKPIGPRDLKSNKEEQKKLKRNLWDGDPKVHLSIKRGEVVKGKKDLEDWQILSNDRYGQHVLSFCLQQPGTARSSKARVFGDESTYKKIFRRDVKGGPFDGKFIIDLLRLQGKISTFRNRAIEDEDFAASATALDVVENGLQHLLACYGFWLKLRWRQIDLALVSTAAAGEEKRGAWEEEVKKDRLSGSFLNRADEEVWGKRFGGLFHDTVYAIAAAMDSFKSGGSVTNFMKSDSNYYFYVLPELVKLIKNPGKKDAIEQSLNIFSEQE